MYWYVSIYSEKCFWPQYIYPKLIPNNGYRCCPLGKLSHLGLEQLQDDNTVDTLSQNQDNIPNTTAMPDTTAIDDHTAGDKPNGAVEMEDAEEDNDGDDANDSEDDDDSTKGVENSYPRRNSMKKDTYEPSFGGQQYSYQHNPMLIQTQGYNEMPENDKDNFILGIIMKQYSLKIGLK